MQKSCFVNWLITWKPSLLATFKVGSCSLPWNRKKISSKFILLSSRAAFLRTTTRKFYQSFACFFPELPFIGLAYQGKDIVFRFIMEYTSLMDFGPYAVIGLFLYEGFWKMIVWLVLELEISYWSYNISWRILVSFRGFVFWNFFLHGEIFEFSYFFFCLKMLFNVNGKATVWHTPCSTLLQGGGTMGCEALNTP